MDTPETVKILIVDDRVDNLTVLEAVLDIPDTVILKARSGTEALALVSAHEFAVVLMDVQMPGMDGFEAARRLRGLPGARDLPVIFVTAIYGDDHYIHEGYSAGAVDYIFKPYNPYILKSKVAVFVDLYRKNKRLLQQEARLREADARERSRQMAMVELRSLQREREMQQKYRDLVESIDHCIVWAAEPSALNFTFISHRAQELTGHPLREWTEDPEFFVSHIYADDRRRVYMALKEIESGREISLEHRFVAYSGRILWFHTSARKIKKTRGEGFELRGLSVDITAVKASQELLREAQERLSRVVRTSPLVLVAIDKSGIITLAEGKALESAALDATSWIGKSVEKLYGKHAAVIEGYRSALSGQDVRLELSFGSRYYEAFFSPQRSESGEISGVVGVAHDITERKAAETERQKLVSLVENTSDFVFIAKPDKKITYVNKSAQLLIGLNTDESWRDRWISEFIGDDEKLRFETEILPTVLSEGSWTGELKFWHGENARVVSTFANILSIRDPENSEVIAIACIGRDITERKTLENNQRLLAEAGACLADSLDIDQTLTKISQLIAPRHADLCYIRLVQDDGTLGLAAACHGDPSVTKRLFEFERKVHSTLDDDAGCGRVARTRKSEVWRNEPDLDFQKASLSAERARFFNELGLRSFIVAPLVAGGRAIGALCVAFKEKMPFAENVALYEELGRRVAQAVESARLYRKAEIAIHTRDEFLSIASHELKTPLTPLKLQFQTIARVARDGKLGSLPQEKLEKMFDRSDRQISRITSLIEDLLNVSKINLGRVTLDLRPTDLGKLISEVAEQFRDQLSEARCTLSLDLEEGLTGSWDPFRLEQVFINLLTNAIKYGPSAPIKVRAAQDGDFAVVTVSDGGIGIAPSDQERIFDLFERAVPARHYGGLGLGLYIVRNIVEAHAGKVSVESIPGRGAAFTVRLPLSATVPLQRENAPAASPAPRNDPAGQVSVSLN